MRVIAIVSLGASAVLGLGALFVARMALPSARPARLAAEIGQPMVVASQDIKYGDKIDAKVLSVARVPAGVIPKGAFTSVAQVLANDAGGPPVALVPIAAREPLLSAKLSGPGARASVAAEIGQGMRAYTIKVTDVSGVGGHALPGDRVDVVLMRDTTPNGEQRNLVANVVLQNVRVLAIDLNADPASSKPSTPNTATLEVNAPDAQKLSLASSVGALSLALRRTGQAEVDSFSTVATRDFLGGGAPLRAGPSGPARARAAVPGVSPILIEVAGSGRSGRRGRSATAPAGDLPPIPPLAGPAAAGAQKTARAADVAGA